MSSFTVTPSLLMDMAASLVRVHDDMVEMKTTAHGYHGLLGYSGLDDELGDFCDGWSYGVDELSDHMGKVIERLLQAAQTYQVVEGEIISGIVPHPVMTAPDH